MGNFASRIHSKEDGKIYNILPMGDMPTVVFGRVIKEHSVPGMQYYFMDGRVKWKDNSKQIGYSYVKPFPHNEDDDNYEWGIPCVFTVPEDLDFSKMNDVEYVVQFCRTAKNLNANTVSPDFIIQEGKIICIRKLNNITPLVLFRKKRYGCANCDCKHYRYSFWTGDGGRVDSDTKHIVRRCFKLLDFFKNQSSEHLLYGSAINSFRNTFTLTPIVSRCPRRKSIFRYTFKRIKIRIKGGNAKGRYYRIN